MLAASALFIALAVRRVRARLGHRRRLGRARRADRGAARAARRPLRGQALGRRRLGLGLSDGRPGRAPHASGRLGLVRHPLDARARAGHRAAGEGLLGLRPARDGERPARRAGPRRARPDLPLDGADPVEPDRGRGLGARGDRRRVPLAGDHDARAAVQPDEAKPRRRARPRPHHPRGDPRPRSREPRVPAGARRADPDDGPHVHGAAERGHRREGDRAGRRAASSASTSRARGRAARATTTGRCSRWSRRRARPASA